MNTKWQRKARLSFALVCLKLARQEIKKFGRQFMKPGESIYDSAAQYGASIKLTPEEVKTVSKMNKQQRKKLK